MNLQFATLSSQSSVDFIEISQFYNIALVSPKCGNVLIRKDNSPRVPKNYPMDRDR